MMKGFSKFVLVIFSVIVLILGVIINLLVIGWLDYNTAFSMVEKILTQTPSNKIILAITELFMLFAIICIFLDSGSEKENKSGKDILMQNDSGKLMISRDTIINLVNLVVEDFPGVKEANTKIQLDTENNLGILVDLTVTKDVIIKELTVNMQNKIKEAIKKASDLEVNEVNVRIKNIVTSNGENN